MYMDVGMDDGDIIKQREIPININDNVGVIHDKMSILGRDLLLETLPSIFNKTNTRTPQDEKAVTYAYNIKREEEKLDFSKNAIDVYNQIRGMYPFPVAYTTLNGEIIKICESEIGNSTKGECGQIVNVYKNGIGVKCSDKEIIITKLKPSGKKEMNAVDFINGRKKENLLGKVLC